MKTVHRQSTLFPFLALLLIQCSAVTLPEPGETFSDPLSTGERGPEMVVIPAGEFLMGCFGTPPPLPDMECHPREEPVRTVKIQRPFAVSKYEVTFEDYDRFTGPTERAADDGWGRGRRPAINVSWPEAQAYVEWLSRETGATYRLLSETEWEYAARAGSTGRMEWGDNKANCGRCGKPLGRDPNRTSGFFPSESLGPPRHAGQRRGVGAGLLEPELRRRSVRQRGVDRGGLRASCHPRRKLAGRRKLASKGTTEGPSARSLARVDACSDHRVPSSPNSRSLAPKSDPRKGPTGRPPGHSRRRVLPPAHCCRHSPPHPSDVLPPRRRLRRRRESHSQGRAARSRRSERPRRHR